MDARQFVVELKEAGARLDIWLTRKMPEFSRNQIKHLLDQGRVLVNHRRVVIAGWELEPSDRVEVRAGPRGVPEIRDEPRPSKVEERRPAPARHESRPPREEQRPLRPQPQQRPQMQSQHQPASKRPGFLEVIFEDRDIIVCDKPAGVLTEPKQGSPHDHLLGLIKNYLQRKHPEARGSYIKLLHRLDRDTSGVIVAAKSKVGEQLEDQFRRHSVDRQYVALVEGRVEKEEGRINFALEKGDFPGGRKIRVIRGGSGGGAGGSGPAGGEGMAAVTDYKVKERYGKATLVAVTVLTGRTHQVRAHFAEIGHPLVGDATYGSKINFSRHALHACLLAFHHPRTKERMRFEAKLPEDLTRLVDQLREQS